MANHARFVYADGPFFAPSGPLLSGAFTDWGPFRAWLPPALGIGPGKGQGVENIDEDPTDAGLVVEKIEQSLRTAMDADDQAGGMGQWVGILGFSQGAKIAASLLLRQQQKRCRSSLVPDFPFGVLIAGPAPLVSLAPYPEDAKTRPLPLSAEAIIRVPTLHVHSTNDCLIPTADEWLYQSCSSDARKLLVWEGDHFVPTRTKDVAAVVDMIVELLDKNTVSIN